jgi:hypothetical protein
MGILASILGSAKATAQQVRSVGEDGFVDLDLPMSSRTRNPSGSTTFVARGILGKDPVGFSIEIHPEWKKSEHEGGAVVFYWGCATIRSIGPASDNFVTALARLYGLSAPNAGMLPIIETEAVGLATDPKGIEANRVMMKLFFNSESAEEHYAEVFLNIDVPNRMVEFHEKDEDYRKPLLRALYAVA